MSTIDDTPTAAVSRTIDAATEAVRARIAALTHMQSIANDTASPIVQLTQSLLVARIHENYEPAISRTAWWHRSLSRLDAIERDVRHWTRTVEVLGETAPTLPTEAPTWLRHIEVPTIAGALYVIEGGRAQSASLAKNAENAGPDGWRYHVEGAEYADVANTVLAKAFKRVARDTAACEGCGLVAVRLLEHIEATLVETLDTQHG